MIVPKQDIVDNTERHVLGFRPEERIVEELLDCFWHDRSADFCCAIFDSMDCIRKEKGKSYSVALLVPIVRRVSNSFGLCNLPA